jgi:hypothetical protein
MAFQVPTPTTAAKNSPINLVTSLPVRVSNVAASAPLNGLKSKATEICRHIPVLFGLGRSNGQVT